MAFRYIDHKIYTKTAGPSSSSGAQCTLENADVRSTSAGREVSVDEFLNARFGKDAEFIMENHGQFLVRHKDREILIDINHRILNKIGKIVLIKHKRHSTVREYNSLSSSLGRECTRKFKSRIDLKKNVAVFHTASHDLEIYIPVEHFYKNMHVIIFDCTGKIMMKRKVFDIENVIKTAISSDSNVVYYKQTDKLLVRFNGTDIIMEQVGEFQEKKMTIKGLFYRIVAVLV